MYNLGLLTYVLFYDDGIITKKKKGKKFLNIFRKLRENSNLLAIINPVFFTPVLKILLKPHFLTLFRCSNVKYD